MSKPETGRPSDAYETTDGALADLRQDLGALDPSPDLGDAIASIAREAPRGDAARPAPGRLLYLAIVIPAAAALVVAAVMVFGGSDTPTRPADVVAGDPWAEQGDASGRARVSTPPSAGQVRVARAANDLPTFDEDGTLPFGYHCKFGADGMFELWTDEHMAPLAQAQHRFVVLRAQGQAAKQQDYRYASYPEEEAVLLLGPELLVRVDALTQGAGKQMQIHTQAGVWKPVPGTRHLELTLGSPDKRGARVRVRCVLSTAYAGTLLIPNALARALGLHQFELPGRFAASPLVRWRGKDGEREGLIQGQRALARIQIKELAYDHVVEVQVREPHHPLQGTLLPGKKYPDLPGWVQASGAIPDRVAYGDRVYFDAEGAFVVESSRPGALMTLGMGKRSAPMQLGIPHRGPLELAFVYAATPARPEATLLLGAYDFGREETTTPAPVVRRPQVRRFDVKWMTLAGTDEPGARVTLARVWRGTTALPGEEGIVVTRVGEDGRIRFPRLTTFHAGPLRMLVEAKAGARFHDLRLDPVARARRHIAVRCIESGFVNTVHGVPSDDDQGVDPIVHLLKSEMAQQGVDGPVEPDMWVIDLFAQRETRWPTVHRVLAAAARLGIRRIRHHQLGAGFGTPDPALPGPDSVFGHVQSGTHVDNVLRPNGPRGAVSFVLRQRMVGGWMLEVQPKAQGTLPAGKPARAVSVALAEIKDAELLRILIGAVGDAVRGQAVNLRIRTLGAQAPYLGTWVVLRAMQQAGATEVVFETPDRAFDPPREAPEKRR